jgi:hypothetical protein
VTRRLLLPFALASGLAAAVAAAGEGPRLVIDPESWDFGRTLKNRVLEKRFTIKNVGDAPLVVERITTTCGCAAALLDDKTLDPGESAQLKVTFQTQGLEGRVERKVLLRSNDRQRDPLEIKLQASVARP